jgi:hypothetical protein
MREGRVRGFVCPVRDFKKILDFDFTYKPPESICAKIDDYHEKVSITKRTSVLAISRKFYVVYQIKKR